MNIKRLMRYGAGCLLMLFGAASCSTDDLDGGMQLPAEDGLYVTLQVDGQQPLTVTTRSEGVAELGENTVSQVDLFLFDEGGTCVKHVAVTGTELTAARACLYSGDNWRDELTASSYTLYALANYTGGTDFATVTTLDALRALTHTDANILGSSPDKTFLMDGSVSFTPADLGTSQKVVVLEGDKTIQLRRAAAKVEATLTIADDAGFTPAGLSAQVVNYATCTAAVAEGNVPADRGLKSMDSYTEELLVQPFDGGKEAKLRFYTYVNDWTASAQGETMLLVNIPYTKDGVETDNYYKIPLLPATATQALERNTHYQITATVSIVGSEEPETPTELQNPRFEIATWKNDTVTVDDSNNPTYLILSEYLIDIRDTDGYDSLKFYSSSPVKVEVAPVNEMEAAAAEIGFTYPGEGTLSPVFFVNAFNQRKQPDDVTVEAAPNSMTATTGNISIDSPNPTNLTIRYITLKVTNDDGLERYVIVQQYPLTYITGVQGSYSYLTTYSGAWPTALTTIDSYGIPQSVQSGLNGHIGDGVDMKSKFYMPDMPYNGVGSPDDPDGPLEGVPEFGRIYRIDGSYGDNVRDNEPASNNRMYNVNITATSDEYIISHPVMAGDVVAQTEENNQFVSPSFMLASQLGNASVMTWDEAQANCQNYVEVSVDGKVYDDWRMPTLAELKIIAKYQNSASDVMFQVLETDDYIYTSADEEADEDNEAGTYRSNPFYWTAIQGRYLYTGADGNDQSQYATDRRIRCVRDVTPEDLNNQP